MIQGELSPKVAAILGDAFETVDGMQVETLELNGKPIMRVVWPDAPTWSQEVRQRMTAAVEPYLLAFTLRTGTPVKVDFTGGTLVGADGVERGFGWLDVRTFRGFDPAEPLSTLTSNAALLSANPELLAAAEQCRGSRSLAGTDANAAMALAYLAVEGLVTHVLGGEGSRTTEADWATAAPLLGVSKDQMLRLLWRSQLGRHVDPRKAVAKLRDRGWPTAGLPGCDAFAIEIVRAYASRIERDS